LCSECAKQDRFGPYLTYFEKGIVKLVCKDVTAM